MSILAPEILEGVRVNAPAADWRVLAFLLGGAVVSTVFFGLAPALQATRLELVQTMRGEGARNARPARARNVHARWLCRAFCPQPRGRPFASSERHPGQPEERCTMYEAIVVGARCAGSPAAMLLARRGHRVLLLDRAAFPSDTLSIHYIHQPGVASLKRWGLLDEIARSNCPPVRQLAFDAGDVVLAGPPAPADGVSDGFAPRRTVLDKILADAAVAAGAELREHFTVEELLTDGERVTGIRGRDRGATVTEKASLVIGADGMRSFVARAVRAPAYHEKPALTCAYYAYWRGVPLERAELYARPHRMVIAGPTNDGQAVIIVYWPNSLFHEVRSDIEGHFLEALELAPSLAERVRKAERTERFRGTADLPNFFRQPHGPGWALVGDAGYHKDPITALGITDAFRDAEFLSQAVHEGLSGQRPMADALAEYHRRRDDAALPLYELTVQNAALQPPPPELQALLNALRGNPEQTSRFFGTMTGAVPIPEFFAPENLRRIVSAAA